VEDQEKCGLAFCSCRVSPGRCYCSVDCEQAATQAVERNFCQCSHGQCCAGGQRALDTLRLSDLISIAPGRVTIECSSLESLREQMVLLAEALDRDAYSVRMSLEPPTHRRPPGRIAFSLNVKTA
jgi:hypothetical protein